MWYLWKPILETGTLATIIRQVSPIARTISATILRKSLVLNSLYIKIMRCIFIIVNSKHRGFVFVI